jgi:hypothetical protein
LIWIARMPDFRSRKRNCIDSPPCRIGAPGTTTAMPRAGTVVSRQLHLTRTPMSGGFFTGRPESS